jgi:hypothetical protein
MKELDQKLNNQTDTNTYNFLGIVLLFWPANSDTTLTPQNVDGAEF